MSRYNESLMLSDFQFWKVLVGEQTPVKFLADVDDLIRDGEFVSREEAFIDYVEEKMPGEPQTKLFAKRLLRIAELDDLY